MKDFSGFTEYLNDHLNSVLYDVKLNLDDVSKSQQTISKEEWLFIEKYVIKTNIAILRQYHNWLQQDSE